MNGLELREIPGTATHAGPVLPRVVAIQGASRHLIRRSCLNSPALGGRAACGLPAQVEEFVYELGSGEKPSCFATSRPSPLPIGAGPRPRLGFMCAVDAAGLASACAAIETVIEEGCDLAIISKFGKQEAERAGLAGAFHAAIAAGCSITSVAPPLTEAWNAFANPLTMFAGPDFEAIQNWRRKLTQATASSIACA